MSNSINPLLCSMLDSTCTFPMVVMSSLGSTVTGQGSCVNCHAPDYRTRRRKRSCDDGDCIHITYVQYGGDNSVCDTREKEEEVEEE